PTWLNRSRQTSAQQWQQNRLSAVKSWLRPQSTPPTMKWLRCSAGVVGSEVRHASTLRKTAPSSCRNSARYSCLNTSSGSSSRAASISDSDRCGLTLDGICQLRQSGYAIGSCPRFQSSWKKLRPFGVDKNQALPSKSVSVGRIAFSQTVFKFDAIA